MNRLHEDDLQLAHRCASGDEFAFEAVVRRHQRLVFGVAYRLLGHRQDAEDVAVTTFLRFWCSARSYTGSSSLKAYLCRICMNLCTDVLKARKRSFIECPPHEGTDPAQEAVLCELECLPEADREVLVLYYLDELSYDEICEILGVSYDVLRTRLTRARARLRAALGVTNGSI